MKPTPATMGLSGRIAAAFQSAQITPLLALLALLLGAVGYRGFVSVEMAHTDVDTIRRTMDYIAEVFA